jgi:hypothetical protein
VEPAAIERKDSMRPPARASWIGLLLLVLATALPAGSGVAVAATTSFKPAGARDGAVLFKLRKLEAHTIRSARLHGRSVRPAKRRLALRRVRTAARRGVLRVFPRAGRARSARRRMRLVVRTSRPVKRRSSEPAEQTQGGPPPNPGDAASARRHVPVGVVSAVTWGQTAHQVDTEIQRLKDLGADWVEVTVGWEWFEPDAKGSFNRGALDYWDQAIAKVQAAGFDVLIRIIPSVPYWASADPSKHVGSERVWNSKWKPEDWAHFADFVHRMASHYAERGIHAYQVWNEPDLSKNWPSGADPAEFARMLSVVYPALKAADPTATVISGGLSYNNYPFLEAMYAAGAQGSFDAVGVHPYTPCRVPPTRSWLDPNGRVAKLSFPALSEIHRTMAAHGDGDKQLWLSEFGWSTSRSGECGVSEQTQAEWLTAAYRNLETMPFVHSAFWYMSRDNPFDPSDDGYEARFGLMSSDMGHLKPSYHALKAYATSSP